MRTIWAGRGLRARLILFLSLSLIATALLVEGFSVKGFRALGIPGWIGSRTLLVQTSLEDSARLGARALSRWLGSRLGEALLLAEAAGRDPSLEAARLEPLAARNPDFQTRLAAFLERATYLRAAYVLDEGGIVLAAAGGSPMRGGRLSPPLPEAKPRLLRRGGSWLVEAPFPGGLLGLVLRSEAIEEILESFSFGETMGFQSLLLDEEGRVEFRSRSVNPALFSRGKVPLDLALLDDLEALNEGRIQSPLGPVRAARATIEPLPGFSASLLALAPREVILGPIRSALLLSALAAILALALGLAVGVYALGRITRPLRILEEAVLAFGRGEPSPALPREAPGELGLIANAFGDLVAKVASWKEELEGAVETRTAELELRAALAQAFAENPDDESAFSASLAALCDSLGAEGGLVHFHDLRKRPRLLDERGGPSQAAEAGLLETLEAAQRGPYTALGRSFRHSLRRRLGGENEHGFVALGRNDRPFEPAEEELLYRVLGEFEPLAGSRLSQARQRAIQEEAERALRASEERFRSFLEESRDMIYIANAEDVIASMNKAGLELLGCPERFEALGRPFARFVLNEEDRRHFLTRISERGFVTDYEIILKRLDGSVFFGLESARAVKNARGQVVEIQGIIRDVSERIEAERELWRANFELAEANTKLKATRDLMVQQEKLASIGQLAAGVAHEINNPVGFLKSNQGSLGCYLTTLQKAWSEAEARAPELIAPLVERFGLKELFSDTAALMAESEDGLARIIRIVGALKGFARSGGTEHFGAYDLNRGVDTALLMAGNELKYVARVEKRLGELPPIQADGGAIDQVLVNLLVNAAQALATFKRSELGRILVETYRSGERAVCIVSDDGPGIPPEILPRIFDPFFSTKEPGKGTGLGLSISYDIVVQKHRGSLSAGRSEWGGALLRLELPLAPHGAVGPESA